MSNLPLHLWILSVLGIVNIAKKDVPESQNGRKQHRQKTINNIPVSLFVLCGVLIFAIIVTTSENVISIKDPYAGMDPFKKEVMQNKKSFEDLTAYMRDDFKEMMEQQRPMIDGSDCNALKGMYERNTAWGSRPYIAYRMVELNCL